MTQKRILPDEEFTRQLIEYYNKFNEDKRLLSRHGQVEFSTTMHYIKKNIQGDKKLDILDVGAGTGRYAIALAKLGHRVSALELVNSNLGRLNMNAKAQQVSLHAYRGNALSLKRFKDNSFDITLVFGPLYHLHSEEEKCQVLSEAKRVTRDGGLIFAAYCMNDYAVLIYAFREKHILESMRNGMLTEDFHCNENANRLYSVVRLEDIDRLNKKTGLNREQIIAPDGPADYFRTEIGELSEEEFGYFLRYQLSVCERMDLIGASSHTVDILRVIKS